MDDPARTDNRDEIQEYDLGIVAASRAVAGFRSRLQGWTIAEATGAAAARVRIHDGASAASPVVAPIALPAGTTSALFVGVAGIDMETGVFLEVVAGSVEAVLYLHRNPR